MKLMTICVCICIGKNGLLFNILKFNGNIASTKNDRYHFIVLELITDLENKINGFVVRRHNLLHVKLG